VSDAIRTIDRKFVFVTGKGGVGKSTVSVAVAGALARGGRRVLLAVTEPAPVSALLGGMAITPDVTKVGEGLFVLWVEPERALRDYGEVMLKSKTAYRALFDNKYAKTFLAAFPGLYQWASLGKAWFHADGDPKLGGSTFDVVVFDAPATGHGLEMLQVPRVINDASPPGILRRDAEAAWHMLQDPRRTGVVVVTLPEELPVQEAIELATEVKQLGVPLAAVVMNAVPETLFSDAERAQLEVVRPAVQPSGHEWLTVAIEHANAERQSQAMYERLTQTFEVPVLRLPWVGSPAQTNDMDSLVSALLT
jgi:anion-transporting  ArsA/GET3 family ATPase